MRIWSYLICHILACSVLFGQEGFSTKWIETSVDPCTNFYQYACGVWMKENPIPSDQSRWGRFQEINERNQKILREILENAARAGDSRSQIEQQIGDYYSSCMDEEGIEAKGLAPIEPALERIRSMKSKEELPEVLAYLNGRGAGALFAFGPMPDLNDSTMHIADLDQGGLGLPERDYYFRDDDKTKEERQKYLAHVQRMFELLGDSAEVAAGRAETVMRIETTLAKGAMEMVKRRDPHNIWHKMSVADLEKLSPDVAWRDYFKASGAPSFDELNVDVPEFAKAVDSIITGESLDDIKTYLSWHLLTTSAQLLPKAFAEEDFDFYRRTLSGAQEMRPRWKRCVSWTNRDLGEALGQAYVKKAFPASSKARMLELIAHLEKALGEDIDGLPWMTRATKEKALEKLHAFKSKIGYPDKWRDYSKLVIKPGDALGNYYRARQHDKAYELAKIGKKVDPNEWQMTPPTVNAYYHPQENTINFPAGILQPPFFDPTLDDAVNYGAVGAVIGHEMTHGFDDSGRQFAANGNLEDWWTKDDAANFNAKAQCFIDQYSAYVAVGDVEMNGKLTLGENVADNGGLRIAFMALMDDLEGKPKKKIDGFTPEQRFFLGWAQSWCNNSTDEVKRLQVQTDPHSLGVYRVNGVVSNSPEFRAAFSCREGQPMVRAKTCRIW